MYINVDRTCEKLIKMKKFLRFGHFIIKKGKFTMTFKVFKFWLYIIKVTK